jgi:hypothetical protein
MEKRDLQVGDVVQINPGHDDTFGGCFMIVTDPKSWGAQGACLGPAKNGLNGTGVAYYRCKFENMEYIGKAEWRVENNASNEGE